MKKIEPRKAKSYYLLEDLTAAIVSEARKRSVKEDRRVTKLKASMARSSAKPL